MDAKRVRRTIPWLLAGMRALAGPVLIAGARCGWNGMTLGALVVGALVSDIYDGILARRWGCDTAGVRLFDSVADKIFYVCTAGALWIARPVVMKSHAGLLAALLILESVSLVVEFGKFGKPASYHSYLAKGWGLLLATSIVAVLATEGAGWLLTTALVVGLVSGCEGLVLTALLPRWQRDVKTIPAGLRLRAEWAATR